MDGAQDGVTGVIANRYRIDHEIGSGGMATVYKAHDARHDAPVAIKVLHPEMVPMIAGARFLREIRITARLQHPNIVTLLDSGEHEGRPFYVMPYVEGDTLEQRIDRDGPLPIAEALDIAARLADALAHAHALGFIHRDVKPSNVLLSHGHVLLSDFGVARAVDAAGAERLTETGAAVGTALYMSPEQGLGGQIDGRSDIYSLGCVLYEMLAGSPPFAGSRRSVIARHVADAMPSLRTVRGTVSPALETVLLKALAKLPADRYANASEFAKAIRRTDAAKVRLVPARWLGRARSALAAAAAIAITMLAWRSWNADRTPLDINRVMVFPLVVPDNFPGSPSIGEEVATVIGHALDGVGTFRWIDGWQLLDPAERDNIRALADDEARALARQGSCAYFLTGRLVVQGNSATVYLNLWETRGGDLAASHGQASGDVEDAWRTGLRAVNAVLPHLVPGTNPNVTAEWNDRGPAAVASFLQGESAFRRARFREAYEHYDDAIAVDSTFAIAAIRGAQAATWIHEVDAAKMMDVASRYELPARYSEFARGYEHYLAGRADSAAAAFRSVIDDDPKMIPAWLQLGEVHMHLLPSASNMDGIAEDAFENALALDPSAIYPLFHLIEIRLRRGDTASAAPMVKRFLDAQPDTSLVRQVEVLNACATGGPRSVDWNGLAVTTPLNLLRVASTFAAGGANLVCAEPALTALIYVDTANNSAAQSRRFFALVGLQATLVKQDRAGDAIAYIDSFFDRWKLGKSLYLFAAPFVDTFEARAEEFVRADSALWDGNYTTVSSGRLWEAGVWQATRGKRTAAAAIADELENRAAASGTQHDNLMSRSVNAYLTLARGDTADAKLRFESLLSMTAPWTSIKFDEADGLGGERLTYATLLYETGEYERAIAVASVLDSPWPAFFPILLRPSLELRARAAAALGDERREQQFRQRLAELRGAGAPEEG